MNPLWFIAAAAGVSGILFSTENVSSHKLSSELAAATPDFLCKPGNGEDEWIFKLAGEHLIEAWIFAFVLAIITKKFANHVMLKVLLVTTIIYSLTFAIIGHMRYTTRPSFIAICNKLGDRSQASLTTGPSELITPFLHPLQHLPEQPFDDDVLMRTYAVIYPHLGEYFLTVEPFLPYAFLVLGFLLEIRPIKAWFWSHLLVLGAVISFAIMTVAHKSEFAHGGPYDLLLNTLLQYAIFYAVTFVWLVVLVQLFRLGLRRLSVVGIFLSVLRLHILGLPQLNVMLETLLLVFFIALIVTTCEFSPGAFALYSLAAYYRGWTTVEWGLVVMLADNGLYWIMVALTKNHEKRADGKLKEE